MINDVTFFLSMGPRL